MALHHDLRRTGQMLSAAVGIRDHFAQSQLAVPLPIQKRVHFLAPNRLAQFTRKGLDEVPVSLDGFPDLMLEKIQYNTCSSGSLVRVIMWFPL
jgi:hypothetical protein